MINILNLNNDNLSDIRTIPMLNEWVKNILNNSELYQRQMINTD